MSLPLGVLIISTCYFCDVKGEPTYFVFGDSLVDSGNNNYIITTVRENMYSYGIDYPTGRPIGQFSNGLNIANFISTYQVITILETFHLTKMISYHFFLTPID